MYDEYFIPLKIIKKILSLISKDEKINFRDLIEKNTKAIKGFGNSKPIFNPKFPIKLNARLSRIAGHIIGDGGIFNLNGTYIAHYSNQSKFLIDQLKDDVIKVFGNVEIYEFFDKRKNIYRITLPAVIGLILNIFLGEQNGSLKHVPKVILNSNRKLKSIFLAALYDDEGSISLGSNDGGGRYVEITQKNKRIIDSVEKMLREFYITPRKFVTKNLKNGNIYYKLVITGKHDLERFHKEISFTLPVKKENLKILLKSYKIDSYKRREMEKLIVKLLAENGKMSIYELAKRLNRKPEHRIRKKLMMLEREGKIKSFRKGPNNLKIYYIV
jgi:hypothetical protein